jgi:tripartite-type tricarboxylate transporter receptor subunit TctC
MSMKRIFVSIPAAAAAVAVILGVGTVASAAAQADFPAKGRAITFIVPANPGGGNDQMCRVLAPALEKELGVPVQVVNRPAAGGQQAYTTVANSKPDGLTISEVILPTAAILHLDPSRGVPWNRESFALLGMNAVDPGVVQVAADGPYKTLKDLIDAAKARPDQITMGVTEYMGQDHLAAMQLQKIAGVKFRIVNFTGNTERDPLILGGKLDAGISNVAPQYPAWKAGTMRLLGVMDKVEHPMLPGVPTFESQGYPMVQLTARGYMVSSKTPPHILEVLQSATKKALGDPEVIKRMTDIGVPFRYMPPAEAAEYWANMESEIEPLVKEALDAK